MRFLFCADPLAPTMPDPIYTDEVAAVRAAGVAVDLIDFTQLVSDDNPRAATRRVSPTDSPELAIYRGWMLRPATYARLFDAVTAKGLHLINSPHAYRHTHYLPESYPIIESVTPKTVWLPHTPTTPLTHVFDLLAPFGDQPIIVKDYVKSQKHAWYAACYIPSAQDRDQVTRVVTRFLELQGADLQEGLVFRAYVPFRPIGQHPQSGMPITMEYRAFVLDGAIIATMPYWDVGAYPHDMPPDSLFAPIVANVQSRFFTMDIAQTSDGTWMIVELGDAQVAGLPAACDPPPFYRTLIQRLAESPTTG
jgi:hypothetical protein